MNFDQMMQLEIQRLFDTENQLLEGLRFMGEKAQSEQLRQAFERHRTESEQQVQRLQQIGQMVGFPVEGQESIVARALVQEAQRTLGNAEPSPVTDAALIAAAQKAEHLEIACYGTARTLAMQVGNQDVADLLDQTLDEEKRTDERLTQLALSGINQQAIEKGGATMM